MFHVTKTDYKRAQCTVVLALLATYVFFVLSFVWYLPNYNLLKTGGNYSPATHAVLKTGTRHISNYTQPVDKGVWLEKVSKTTPETKRFFGSLLIGVFVLLPFLFAGARGVFSFLKPRYQKNQGYSIFARQYAYLSLHAFRI